MQEDGPGGLGGCGGRQSFRVWRRHNLGAAAEQKGNCGAGLRGGVDLRDVTT